MSLRTAATFLLKAAVTCGALWALSRLIDVSRLGAMLRQANPELIGLAALLTLAQLLVTAARWQLLHQLLSRAAIPVRATVVAYGRGMLVGQFFPSTLGIDITRVGLAAQYGGLTGAVRSVIADRILTLWSLVAIILLTLPAFSGIFGGQLPMAPLGILSAAGLTMIAAVMLWPSVFERLPFAGRMAGRLAADTALVVRSRSGLEAVALSFASHLLSALMFLVLVRSVDPSAPWLAAVLIISPAMLIGSLPVSLNGWGVREGTIASAFALAGVDPVTGVTASILFGLSGPLMGFFGEACSLSFARAQHVAKAPKAQAPQTDA